MNQNYQQQRARVLRLYDGRCACCGQVISERTGFHAHHLLIPKGAIRNRGRREELDCWINLIPGCMACHPNPMHAMKRELCLRHYEMLGEGDIQAGYEKAWAWCKTVLRKTEPDIPAPGGDE